MNRCVWDCSEDMFNKKSAANLISRIYKQKEVSVSENNDSYASPQMCNTNE